MHLVGFKTYQKPDHIEDINQFINEEGYLDEYLYYRDHVLKIDGLDLFKNSLIQSINLKINKLMFEIKTQKQRLNQNKISDQEFKKTKGIAITHINIYSQNIQRISEITPLEFLRLSFLKVSLELEIKNTLFNLIKPNIEPLYDEKKERTLYSFKIKNGDEFEDAFKSALNIKSLISNKVYLITPNHIDSINKIIKQHRDKIPKKYNGLPIKQIYLEHNKYYLFCT